MTLDILPVFSVVSQVLRQCLDERLAISVDHEPDDIAAMSLTTSPVTLWSTCCAMAAPPSATICTRKRHPGVFLATLLMAPLTSSSLHPMYNWSTLLFKTPPEDDSARRHRECQPDLAAPAGYSKTLIARDGHRERGDCHHDRGCWEIVASCCWSCRFAPWTMRAASVDTRCWVHAHDGARSACQSHHVGEVRGRLRRRRRLCWHYDRAYI